MTPFLDSSRERQSSYTFTFNKANISYGKISFPIEDEGGNLGFVTPSTNKNDCEPDHLFFLDVPLFTRRENLGRFFCMYTKINV